MTLDRQATLARIEGDQELYTEICGIFSSETPVILEKLQQALAVDDMTLATRYAHSLKSSAATIGAIDLQDTARTAEAAGRAGNAQELRMLVPQLSKQLEQVLKELE